MLHDEMKSGEFVLKNGLPVGYFLSKNEEENLRMLFDAPQLIRNSVVKAPERRTFGAPLLAGAVAGMIIVAAIGFGVLKGSPTEISQMHHVQTQTVIN